ncbi:hypothetical protein [Vibrio sp. 10N]|uniref:hypothetical protein n=1 Tax=Vibrio sp. 10N TaxID=3058938 RepID=UPI0028129C4E|nr:hypothetical protein VB10N_18480 [Vibrio sp. 10N]
MSTYLNILSADAALMHSIICAPPLEDIEFIELPCLDGKPTVAFFGSKFENHSILERLSKQVKDEDIYYRYTNTGRKGADSALVHYRNGITRVLLKFSDDQIDALRYQKELIAETHLLNT